MKANTPWDYGAQLFSSVGFAVPDFLEAVLLIYFFAAKWGHITGLPTSGWDSWQSKVLPVITLSLTPMTYFARLVRGSMLETLQQDYVRTARAKGLRRHRIVGLHVLRNSLIPAVTAAAPLLGYIITGSFIVENIFAIPGIGQYYVTSVTGQDYAVVMGLTVLLSVIIIIANMVADIMYGVLDPRIRDSASVPTAMSLVDPQTELVAVDEQRAAGLEAGRAGRADEPLARRAPPLHEQQGGAWSRRSPSSRCSPT